MTTKTCTKCLEEKDISEFAWSIKGIKSHPLCRSCRTKYQAEYYERTKHRTAAARWQNQVDRREEARKYVFAYLSEHVCMDCGEYDPIVLTFDHVRGTKVMGISQMINQGYSLQSLQEEIDKCEVVCNNCHLRREKKRRGTKYWDDD